MRLLVIKMEGGGVNTTLLWFISMWSFFFWNEEQHLLSVETFSCSLGLLISFVFLISFFNTSWSVLSGFLFPRGCGWFGIALGGLLGRTFLGCKYLGVTGCLVGGFTENRVLLSGLTGSLLFWVAREVIAMNNTRSVIKAKTHSWYYLNRIY